MDAIERIPGPVEPRPDMPGPLRARADEAGNRPGEPAARPGVPEPIRAPEPIRRKFQARLNYDPLEADVFIEILDPATGDVLRRLPAEELDKDEALRAGGAILNRLA